MKDLLKWQIAVLPVLLALCGILTIAATQSGAIAPLELVSRQWLHLALALGIVFGVGKIPFPLLRRATPLLAAAGILSLAAVLLWGSRINGMRGWFRCGDWFSLQPSELFIGIYLLALALLFESLHATLARVVLGGVFAAIWVLLIALQPDFGVAVLYAGSLLLMLWLAGCRKREIALLLLPAGAAVLWFLGTHPYAVRRICACWTPQADPLGAGWHTIQFELAATRGGWFGTKTTFAVWSRNYLPLAYNDSIYSAIVETGGLVCALGVLALYAALFGALFRLARRPQLSEGAVWMIRGAACTLAWQVLLHVSVNLALVPATGITLPWISYGGSSMIGSALMLGIAFSAAGSPGR